MLYREILEIVIKSYIIQFIRYISVNKRFTQFQRKLARKTVSVVYSERTNAI